MANLNLGVVTAYGYAKDNGYTGTEEQFAELMASYATVAEQAAQSATDAAGAKTDAESARDTATSKASEAAGYAGTASTKAGQAADSATAANTSKEAAADSAEDSEAWAVGQVNGTDVASSAAQYHNNSKYYAQAAAQSAQTAEDVLDSIPQDYTTLSNDVTDLKNDYNQSFPADTRNLLVGNTIHRNATMTSTGDEQASDTYDYVLVSVTAGTAYKLNVTARFIRILVNGSVSENLANVSSFTPSYTGNAAVIIAKTYGIDNTIMCLSTEDMDSVLPIKEKYLSNNIIDKRIMDELSSLKDNIAPAFNSDNWTPVKCTASYDDGVVSLTANTSTPEFYAKVASDVMGNLGLIVGHKYYVAVTVKPTTISLRSAKARVYFGNEYGNKYTVKVGEKTRISDVFTLSSLEEISLLIRYDYYTPVGDSADLEEVEIIDLTKAFGSGNEPSKKQIDQMLRQVPAHGLTTLDHKSAYAIVGQEDNRVVVVAGYNSTNKGKADFVCDGFHDQEKINSIFEEGYRNIYFDSVSTFIVDGEINIPSNATLKSDGAVFTTTTSSEYTNRSLISVGETTINIAENPDDLAVGMYMEISDTSDSSHWFCGYITALEISNRKITLDTEANYQIEIGNAKIRNVSSCFSARNQSNILVEGITVDWNYPNNSRSPETFFSQNGIHCYYCEKVKIRDCKIINGGRHGILFLNTSDSYIQSCYMNNWGEHGIDLYNYTSGGASPDNNHNIVSDCISSENGMCGIQLHSGSGTTINGCHCYDNSRSGISVNGVGHDNTISNCQCIGNAYAGIYVHYNEEDVVISGCLLLNNTKEGIQIDGSSKVVVNGCLFRNNLRGILIYDSTDNLVGGCQFFETTAKYGVNIDSASSRNVVSGNAFHLLSGSNRDAIYDASSGQKNIAINNTLFDGSTVSMNGNDSVAQNNMFVS